MHSNKCHQNKIAEVAEKNQLAAILFTPFDKSSLISGRDRECVDFL